VRIKHPNNRAKPIDAPAPNTANRPRLDEVAKLAGVSIATASRIINRVAIERFTPDTQRRVNTAAEQLGYTANYHGRAMRTGRSQTVGVTFDIYNEDELDGQEGYNFLTVPYFSGLLSGIEAYLRHHDYRMMLIGADRNNRAPEHGVDGLRQGRLDGLIVLGHVVMDRPDDILKIAPVGPIVVLGCDRPTLLPTIGLDIDKGMSLVADHLLTLGHRRVAMLSEKKNQQRAVALERYLKAGGASLVVIQFESPKHNEFADRAQQALTRHLMESGDSFTAVACYNDITAVGAIRALLSRGLRVPHDVSVVGFDNTTAAVCIPALTTIDHRLHDLGQLAATRALELFNDPSAISLRRGQVELLEPRLIISQSSASLKQ